MSNDTIRIMCPNVMCRRVLAVPISARGRTVRCRFCAMSIKIPQAKPVAPPPLPAAEDGAPESDEQESQARKAG
jgi:hypothetical protein